MYNKDEGLQTLQHPVMVKIEGWCNSKIPFHQQEWVKQTMREFHTNGVNNYAVYATKYGLPTLLLPQVACILAPGANVTTKSLSCIQPIMTCILELFPTNYRVYPKFKKCSFPVLAPLCQSIASVVVNGVIAGML